MAGQVCLVSGRVTWSGIDDGDSHNPLLRLYREWLGEKFQRLVLCVSAASSHSRFIVHFHVGRHLGRRNWLARICPTEIAEGISSSVGKPNIGRNLGSLAFTCILHQVLSASTIGNDLFLSSDAWLFHSLLMGLQRLEGKPFYDLAASFDEQCNCFLHDVVLQAADQRTGLFPGGAWTF